MREYLRLCRLYYAVPMALTFTLTVCYAQSGNVSGQIILSTLALALVIAGSYVFNDIFDEEADRINAPDRPLAAGSVTLSNAVILGSLLVIAGLAMSWLTQFAFAVTLFLVAGGLMFYNRFSKRLGVFKPVLVAILMTSIYPLAIAQAGGAFGSRAWTLAVFPAWMFFSTIGYQILKDIRDITGDEKIIGKPTFVQQNPDRWRKIANGCVLFGSAFLIGPFFLGCHSVYLAFAALAILAGIISTRQAIRQAIGLLYLEFFLVGIAATADVIVFGF